MREREKFDWDDHNRLRQGTVNNTPFYLESTFYILSIINILGIIGAAVIGLFILGPIIGTIASSIFGILLSISLFKTSQGLFQDEVSQFKGIALWTACGTLLGGGLGVFLGTLFFPGVGTLTGGLIGSSIGAPLGLALGGIIATFKVRTYGTSLLAGIFTVSGSGSLGVALGTLIGTFCFPGLGSVIGALAGGAFFMGVSFFIVSLGFLNQKNKTAYPIPNGANSLLTLGGPPKALPLVTTPNPESHGEQNHAIRNFNMVS